MSAPSSPTDRQTFRATVADIAAKAHEKLPASSGRIDSAVKLVLAGDVELFPDGGAKVASRTDATVTYHTVNGHCDCRDYTRAPGHLCSHRLAYGIARRATEMLPPPPEPLMIPPAPTVPLPEAPASVNSPPTIGGRQVQLTLRDTDETRLLARLTSILAQYPPTAVEYEAATAHVCPMHQVPMRQTTKNGRSWYSRRTGQGWCKGGAQ